MNIIYNICNWWKLYVRPVSVSGFFRRVRLDPIRIRFSKGWIRSWFSYKINRILITGKFGQVCTKFLFLSNLFYLKFEFGHQINIFFSSSTHSISVAPCSSLLFTMWNVYGGGQAMAHDVLPYNQNRVTVPGGEGVGGAKKKDKVTIYSSPVLYLDIKLCMM